MHIFNSNVILLNLLFLTGFSLPIICNAQTTINNPITGPQNSDVPLQVNQVVFSDTGTSIALTAHYRAGRKLNIPKESFISIEEDTTKYYVGAAIGVQIGKNNLMPKGNRLTYRLYFPKLKLKKSQIPAYIHFGENLVDGKQLYAIYTNDSLLAYPKSLYGNWYDKTNGNLVFVIRPDIVVARKQVYQIAQGKTKDGEIALQSRLSGPQTLYYKKLPDGSYQLGFSKKARLLYSQDRKACLQEVSNVGLEQPALDFDSCTFRGYIWGYENGPKGKEQVMTIYVNNILTGNQDNYAVEIQPDGSFTTKIPFYYPNDLIIRSDYFKGASFVEPGKELFVVLGDTATIYMGELAKLNEDLNKLNGGVFYNFYDIERNILKEKPDSLKAYVRRQVNKGYKQLDSMYKIANVSQRAYEIKKSEISHNALQQMLSYEMLYEIAYRQKHHLGYNGEIPGGKPDIDYYHFLSDSLMNSSSFLLGHGGSICLNRIKFLKMLRPINRYYTMQSIAAALKVKNAKFTKVETELINGPSPFEQNIKDTAIISAYQRNAEAFCQKNIFEAGLYNSKDFRDSVLATMGIAPGLATDIMMVQDFSSKVEDQRSPVDEAAVIRIKSAFHNRDLAGFIEHLNRNMVAQIAANKDKKGGYTVLSNEQIPGEALWDSIIHQHRGNVLYIDFWETWCSPCRQAIRKIITVKKELKGKPVNFLYISSHRSPDKDWQNFLPTITGDHYRLSDEQWDYLKKKFKIEGIPHVVIVDKNGKVVDPYYREIDMSRVKKKIESYL